MNKVVIELSNFYLMVGKTENKKKIKIKQIDSMRHITGKRSK